MMTVLTKVAYCKDRLVDVDLEQGFHRCIEENQCFSDEPCPLNHQFDQLATQAQTGANSTLNQQK
jgi:hypothetical protein